MLILLNEAHVVLKLVAPLFVHRAVQYSYVESRAGEPDFLWFSSVAFFRAIFSSLLTHTPTVQLYIVSAADSTLMYTIS